MLNKSPFYTDTPRISFEKPDETGRRADGFGAWDTFDYPELGNLEAATGQSMSALGKLLSLSMSLMPPGYFSDREKNRAGTPPAPFTSKIDSGCSSAPEVVASRQPLPPTPTVPAKDEKPPKQAIAPGASKTHWTEAEAAEFCNYSVEYFARLRRDGEIPPELYRQRVPRGKVLYYPKKVRDWYENQRDR